MAGWVGRCMAMRRCAEACKRSGGGRTRSASKRPRTGWPHSRHGVRSWGPTSGRRNRQRPTEGAMKEDGSNRGAAPALAGVRSRPSWGCAARKHCHRRQRNRYGVTGVLVSQRSVGFGLEKQRDMQRYLQATASSDSCCDEKRRLVPPLCVWSSRALQAATGSAMPWWRSKASSWGSRPRKALKLSMALRLPPISRMLCRYFCAVVWLVLPSEPWVSSKAA